MEEYKFASIFLRKRQKYARPNVGIERGYIKGGIFMVHAYKTRRTRLFSSLGKEKGKFQLNLHK